MIENPKIVHDTIRVTKIIVDTVRGSSKDSMDLLTKMDSFYNNAWTKLILVVTIAFAIIGILVPFLIQWYQKRELRLSEAKLKLDIEKAIETATTGFTNYVDKQVKQKFDELDQKVGKHVGNLDGKTFHLQGRILYDQGDHSSIGSFFVALENYADADEQVTLKRLMELLISEDYELKTFGKTEIKEIFDNYELDYKKTLRNIREKFDDSEIKGFCQELETIIDSLS